MCSRSLVAAAGLGLAAALAMLSPSEALGREPTEAADVREPHVGTALAALVPLLPLGLAASLWGADREDLIPWAVLVGVAGASIGPSAGHWYAGDHGRAWATASGRLALYGLGTLIIAFGDSGTFGRTDFGASTQILMGSVMIGAAVGLGFWDVLDAADAVRRRNRLRADARATYGLPVPLLVPRVGGRLDVGLGVAVGF